MTISLVELLQGCRSYWLHEPRDAMYRISVRLVDQSWENPSNIADALGVILLTWHQSFYRRFGSFDFNSLEDFIKKNKKTLASFRARSITSFNSSHDAEEILSIFDEALDALKSRSRTAKRPRRSPVAVAKALHTVAPDFFPLWDNAIAKGLGFHWRNSDEGGARYLPFMQATQTTINALSKAYSERRAGLPFADNLAAALSTVRGRDQTILKFLDEYYYMKYTVPQNKARAA